jgi:HPt (histidine-containing phosphotransfer) domain-containing protein
LKNIKLCIKGISALNPNQPIKTNLKSDVDLSNLIRTAGGDMNFVKEMINQFEESTLTGIHDMHNALEANELSEIEELAHKLLSAPRHLGINHLVSNFKEIEKYAKSGDKTKLLALIDKANANTLASKDELWKAYVKILEE